ncbi:MAG: hypothetical protein QMC89_02105 [Candidatus Hodarchaeaceae archaeon]|nr:hypothetical protein [Candidatus Hodarchaeaceae archaeon]
MRSYLDFCDVGLFRLGEREVPVAMLGTSPFCGAGQFGARAMVYYQTFYERPQNMVRLISDSAELGVPAVHVVAYPRICQAVEAAAKACGIELCVIGTIGLGELMDEFKNMVALNAAGIALHAGVIDHDLREVERCATAIRDAGAAVGVATHQPWKTLPKLCEVDVDFVMAPVNKLGYMMGPRPEETLRLLSSIKLPVVAIKPLAAGELKPAEAFDFLRARVDAVAVGIASKGELAETWQAIKKHFTRRAGVW